MIEFFYLIAAGIFGTGNSVKKKVSSLSKEAYKKKIIEIYSRLGVEFSVAPFEKETSAWTHAGKNHMEAAIEGGVAVGHYYAQTDINLEGKLTSNQNFQILHSYFNPPKNAFTAIEAFEKWLDKEYIRRNIQIRPNLEDENKIRDCYINDIKEGGGRISRDKLPHFIRDIAILCKRSGFISTYEWQLILTNLKMAIDGKLPDEYQSKLWYPWYKT